MNAFTLRMIAIVAAVLYGLSFVVFDMNSVEVVIGALVVAGLLIAAATLARGEGAGAERQRLRLRVGQPAAAETPRLQQHA